MSKKTKEEEVSYLKELMSTPKGKAIVFFGAYVIFFMIIAIFARVGGNNSNRVYESGSGYQFSLTNIESNNYKFNYKINVDGNLFEYNGSRTSNEALFSDNNLVDHYFNGDVYFSKINGVWINVSNPYKYSEFLDVENISKLLENATYVSKTTYESGRDVYNFSISSATISKLFENVDLDIEEIPNEIMISVDENNYVHEVKFTLDSYCKAKELCVNNMSIDLNYEQYGEVEEITSPLE